MPAKDFFFPRHVGPFLFARAGKGDGGPCAPGAHWSRLAPEDHGFASVVLLLAFEKRRGRGSASFRVPVFKKKAQRWLLRICASLGRICSHTYACKLLLDAIAWKCMLNRFELVQGLLL